jgi:flagellar hook-associated protein 2
MASATSSISGLSSGLDTATIIDQLMTLEAAPQTRLKSRLTSEQSQVTTLQSLNTQVAALATQAKELAKTSSWKVFSATSSLTGLTATASTGALQGGVTMTVNSLAVAHRLTYSSTAALTDTVVTNGTDVKLTVGSTTTTLTTDGTLAGLASALNASGTGVQASTVKLDDGTYRLSVQATSTGAAAAFTLTDSTGADLLGGATVTQGVDASVTIGTDTIHSASNTFTGVVPGVDFTISSAAVGQTGTITVAADTSSATTKVKSLVTSINALVSQIDTLTNYNATTKTSGPLSNEGSLRELRSTLVNALYPNDGTTMADIGIQTDRYGKLTFDEDKFATALKADPDALATRFTASGTAGYANRLATVADLASNSTTGTITASITGRNSSIKTLQDSIDNWTDRLDLRRTALTRQFTNMETTLNTLNSTSSWLAGQISSLPSWDSLNSSN